MLLRQVRRFGAFALAAVGHCSCCRIGGGRGHGEMPRRHAGCGAICVYSRYSPFSHRGPGAPVKRTLFFPNLLLITFAISGTVGPCAKQPTSTVREAGKYRYGIVAQGVCCVLAYLFACITEVIDHCRVCRGRSLLRGSKQLQLRGSTSSRCEKAVVETKSCCRHHQGFVTQSV